MAPGNAKAARRLGSASGADSAVPDETVPDETASYETAPYETVNVSPLTVTRF
jgi:hypothetical protein